MPGRNHGTEERDLGNGCLDRFAREYVALYYTHDTDVTADTELAAWLDELSNPRVGALDGIGPDGDGRLHTRADLATFVAEVLFLTSPYHAAVQHALYDNCAMMPSASMASWGPGPVPGHPFDTDHLLEQLAPVDVTKVLLDFCYVDQQQIVNQLGVYPDDHFADPRVAAVLEASQSDLTHSENRIARRNRTRPEAYRPLLPSRLPRSIQI